ncbi:phage major capsid protein, partial [uncultured Parasutterella sp.]|uniref:phage major capsid protein n=1 Tax=uncultured Parasutterella sp. TaxID=1263098 RepID=UPI0027296A61
AQTANVKDIGNCFIVTKDLMEDSQALADYINFRVQYGVKQRVESQLLNGDGTNANLSGLLMTGNYTPHGFDPAANPEITNQVDLIGFAALAVKSVGLTPNVTIMNPVDYFKLRCLKDSNGRYLFSDPMGPSNRPVWDTYVVESSAMPKGKFLTLDTNMACMIYDRKETVVEVGYEDGNNFRKGLVTIKADRRLAFAIERPSGIVGGDLVLTKTNTTE